MSLATIIPVLLPKIHHILEVCLSFSFFSLKFNLFWMHLWTIYCFVLHIFLNLYKWNHNVYITQSLLFSFFQSTLRNSPILIHIAKIHSLLLLTSIPLHNYTWLYLPTLLLMNICSISRFCYYKRRWCKIFLHMSLGTHTQELL